ncbi:16S rRNA (guanine(527)-N(7))-methyltransferase RsmG [Natribacillus halophilus]|uniref:Ribosomal RNA small subunit methyltransferase G n=1 Tax=Natribacillus halophilus TaxID=549003 RepID=A0A1G8L2H0_9BACI|nr:16S rRNA (guanine(527)-N(7))-methyltransferase RsmG [Natribacillus halophilus]SDI49863.1 16S rRNA m(7)G-527 methyltransferase [Natribacillus halophilus]
MKEWEKWLKDIDLSLADRQKEQFKRYYELLVDWNKHMNLTAISDEHEVYEKHFYDSLLATCCYPFEAVSSLADIGGGAGFPGIPLKICFPHLHLTVIEATKKRVQFLEELTKALSLEDVHLIHTRAEDAAREEHHRDRYDIVIARAVAKMPVLAELCLPFVHKHEVWMALKGKSGEEELATAREAIRVLNGGDIDRHYFELPTEASERSIYVIGKKESTPKSYPRNAGIIKKKPL